jgi:hypothetical protein
MSIIVCTLVIRRAEALVIPDMVVAVGVTTGKAAGIDPGPGTVASRDGAQRAAGGQSRAVPGLFELRLVVAPDGGLAGPDRPETSLGAAELAGLVRRTGGEGLDVRILAPAGEQNLPTLTALADLLGCDVLVPPAGARLRYLGGTGRSDRVTEDVAAVDPVTGYPMDWVTIAPAGPVGPLSGWFDTARGRVVPRTGTVALPLAGGGLMLATRSDFGRRRALAAALRPGHPELLTVGTAVRSGDFVVGDYGGRTTVRDGSGLAVVLGGLLLYGAELRMWLTWPEPAEERRRLAGNLTALAEVTGATVWAPAEGGRAELAEDSRDLRALRADGEAMGWQAYGAVGLAAFRSDVDGRLVPAGGAAVTRHPGVPLVSVQPARERAMAVRYADLPPAREVFRVDLAVLADGRLAARYADGSLLAVSGGQLRQLLRDAGWQGAPVALLSAVSPEQAAGAQRHATELARQLGCPVTFLDPGADSGRPAPDLPAPDLPAPAPGRPARQAGPSRVEPAQPPVPPSPRHGSVPRASLAALAARVPVPPPVQLAASSRADEAVPGDPARDRPATAGRADGGGEPRDHGRPEPDAGTDWRYPGHREVPSGTRPGGSSRADDPATVPLSRFIDGPRLEPAGRSVPPHGIAWLPPAPQTNSESFDVYVECAVDPEQALAHGVPSGHLFLLGHLGRDRLAARTSAGHLLQVRVRARGAIDVGACEVAVPRSLAQPLSDTDVYLLPVAWLARCRAVAAVRVAGAAQPSSYRFPEPQPLLVRCTGADHAVPGLPTEAVRWPRGSLRGAATRFATLPEDATDGPGPWLPLHRHRPAPGSGRRIVQLRVERGRAIDVAATAAELGRLSQLHSAAAELVAAGVDVLLPAVSYPYTTVLRAFRGDGKGWQRAPVPRGTRLDAWMADTAGGIRSDRLRG